MDPDVEVVARSILDRFSHLGEARLFELSPVDHNHVVRHSMLPPIGFTIQKAPGVSPRVDVYASVASEFPITGELLGWLVEVQSAATTLFIRYRIAQSGSSKGPVRALSICFSMFVSDVGSETWSAALGQLMQHTVDAKAGFTERFGGRPA